MIFFYYIATLKVRMSTKLEIAKKLMLIFESLNDIKSSEPSLQVQANKALSFFSTNGFNEKTTDNLCEIFDIDPVDLEKPKVINPIIYGYDLKYSNKLELIQKAVSIFSNLERIKHGKTMIRKKVEEVLSFFIMGGVNENTRNTIIKTIRITKENLTQIEAELFKSGYIIRDRLNRRVKTLHPDIMRLYADVANSEIKNKRAILIRFI